MSPFGIILRHFTDFFRQFFAQTKRFDYADVFSERQQIAVYPFAKRHLRFYCKSAVAVPRYTARRKLVVHAVRNRGRENRLYAYRMFGRDRFRRYRRRRIRRCVESVVQHAGLDHAVDLESAVIAPQQTVRLNVPRLPLKYQSERQRGAFGYVPRRIGIIERDSAAPRNGVLEH